MKYTFIFFAICFLLLSCDKSRDTIVVDKTIERSVISSCVDIWNATPGNFNWAVTYACPANSVEAYIDSLDIKRQRRIDSIIKKNSLKYPENVFSNPIPSPCVVPNGDFGSVTRFGISAVNNNINPILDAFAENLVTPTTFTIYVFQNGIADGGVFFSIQQNELVKTFGFYPSVSYTFPLTCGGLRSGNLTVPGEARNNSDLPYSVSVSVNLSYIQFVNLKAYLRNQNNNNGATSFYNYCLNTFNEVTYAIGAANIVGLQLLPAIPGTNSFDNARTPYELGQNIKARAHTTIYPSNVAYNLDGGITPGVQDGEYE